MSILFLFITGQHLSGLSLPHTKGNCLPLWQLSEIPVYFALMSKSFPAFLIIFIFKKNCAFYLSPISILGINSGLSLINW